MLILSFFGICKKIHKNNGTTLVNKIFTAKA